MLIKAFLEKLHTPLVVRARCIVPAPLSWHSAAGTARNANRIVQAMIASTLSRNIIVPMELPPFKPSIISNKALITEYSFNSLCHG